MKTKIYSFSYFYIAILSLIIMGCSSNDAEKQAARLSVRMADAPGDYDEVNVEVTDVMFKIDEADNEQGWESIGNIAPGVYDLLSLTGGTSIVLAENEIPLGYIGQVKLVLGTHNTVKKNGVTYPLKIPSGKESGLKFFINKTLEEGKAYDYFLDFDVEHSIAKEAGSSGKYILNPVIHISEIANSGVIKGKVTPLGVKFIATVKINGHIVSTYGDEMGTFQINGVPEGAYSVTLKPQNRSGLSKFTVENVLVVDGSVSNMGNLVFE